MNRLEISALFLPQWATFWLFIKDFSKARIYSAVDPESQVVPFRTPVT